MNDLLLLQANFLDFAYSKTFQTLDQLSTSKILSVVVLQHAGFLGKFHAAQREQITRVW